MHTVLILNILNKLLSQGSTAFSDYLVKNFGKDYDSKNLFDTKETAEKVIKGYLEYINTSEDEFVELVNEELKKRNWKFGALKYKKFSTLAK